MHVLHSLVRPFKPKLVSSGITCPAGSQQLTPHAKARKTCRINERLVDGIYIYDLQRAAPSEQHVRRRVYYFAGGGWQAPPSSQHWTFCAEICQKVPDTAVSVVSHPLAPNSPAATTIPQLMVFYKSILQQATEAKETVILAGDSSGGNIVLSLVLHTLMQDPQVPRPHAILAICPAVDLQPMKNEKPYSDVVKNDPILTLDSHNQEAAQWAADVDPAMPWISPINADVSVLAKSSIRLFGVTAGYDILSPDALSFRDRCEEAGVTGEWLHWERQMHCFPLAFMYGLRESVQSKDWILEKISSV